MEINPDFSIVPLVEATVKKAIADAKAGNMQARRWLNGTGVHWISACIDVHPLYIRRAINNQLLPSRQRSKTPMPPFDVEMGRLIEDRKRGKQKTAQEAPGRKNNHTSVVNVT